MHTDFIFDEYLCIEFHGMIGTKALHDFQNVEVRKWQSVPSSSKQPLEPKHINRLGEHRMSYSDKYQEIASDLWADTYKGPLFDNNGKLVRYTGLSGGESVIYKVCAAIGVPASHSMPPLDDICHRLSDDWVHKILKALTEMFTYRC